jgi:outer membrane protein OmpA-like peptidoglycan-associated protein
MKTILMMLLVGGVAAAGTGPDFVAAKNHTPATAPVLTASSSRMPIEPTDIVTFANDSAGLIDSAVDQIDQAATWLAAHPGYTIVLEGHTDSTGTSQYNATLAFDRAAAVRSRLQTRGITPDRIVLAAYGESAAGQPVNINDRRVVMYATKLAPGQVALRLQERGALRTAFGR